MGKFKVGDRVRCIESYASEEQFKAGDEFVVSHVYGDNISVERDSSGNPNGWLACKFELANDSPIRTVTRREIVPGVYGEVTVERIPFSGFEISYSSYGNAHKLRAAARIFNEIADVLEEQSAEAKGEAA